MSNRARDHFSSTLIDGNRKSANATGGAYRAKLQIRENVLAEIGADKAHVLDAFCGAGEMYRGVWHKAASYVGIDEEWFRDERTVYVADNRRVMRAINLSSVTILDGDAFGGPWDILTIFAARRPVMPGERLGIVLSEGSGLRLRMGHIPDTLSILAGLQRRMPGASRLHEEIIDRALATVMRRMNCRIVRQWRAKVTKNAQMFYLGFVIEGLAIPA